MDKFKSILAYIGGFISAILLVFVVLLLIIKTTIYNRNYVINKLEKNDYYEKLYTSINKEMKNSMISSGLDESILDNIFNQSNVKRDTVNLLDSLYIGMEYKVDLTDIHTKLNKNIEEFLDKHNEEITDKESLNSFTNSIVDIYEKRVTMYGYLDGVSGAFSKISKKIDIIITILIILYISIIYLSKYILKKKILGSTLMISGMLVLFTKYYIYEKIDIKNLLIISDDFSLVLRKILLDISSKMLIYSIIMIIFGLSLIIIESFRKRKKKIRM